MIKNQIEREEREEKPKDAGNAPIPSSKDKIMVQSNQL